MNDYFARKIEAVERLFHTNSLTDWLIAGIVAAAVWFSLLILRHFVSSRYEKYSAAQQRLPLRLLAYLSGNTRQFLFFALALYAGEEMPDVARAHRARGLERRVPADSLSGGAMGRAGGQVLPRDEAARARCRSGVRGLARHHQLRHAGADLVARDPRGARQPRRQHHRAARGVGRRRRRGGPGAAERARRPVRLAVDRARQALRRRRQPDHRHLRRQGGAHRHQDDALAQRKRRANHPVQRGHSEEPRVRNYARVQEQRILAALRIAYGTPPDRLARIPALLEGIVRTQKKMRASSALPSERRWANRVSCSSCRISSSSPR